MSSAYRCFICNSQVAAGRKHTCKKFLAPSNMGVVIQARLHDGRKETHNQTANLEYAIESYKRFVKSTLKYPHRRKRFAYAVRVYLKG